MQHSPNSPRGRAPRSPRFSPNVRTAMLQSTACVVQNMTSALSQVKVGASDTFPTNDKMTNISFGGITSKSLQNPHSRTGSSSKSGTKSGIISCIEVNQKALLSERRRYTRSARSRGLAKCFADVVFFKTREEGSIPMYYSNHSALDEGGALRTPNKANSQTSSAARQLRAAHNKTAHNKVPSPSDSIFEFTEPAPALSKESVKADTLLHNTEILSDKYYEDSERLSEADLLSTNVKCRGNKDQASRFVVSEASPDRDLLYSSKAVRPRSIRGEAVPQIPFNKSTGALGVSASSVRKQPPHLNVTLRGSFGEEVLSQSRSFSTKIQPPRISSQPRMRSLSSDARTEIKPAARLAFPVPPKRQQLTLKDREILLRKRARRESTWISDKIDGKKLTLTSLHRKLSASRSNSAQSSPAVQRLPRQLFIGPQRIASPQLKQNEWERNSLDQNNISCSDLVPKTLNTELKEPYTEPHYIPLSSHPKLTTPLLIQDQGFRDMASATLSTPEKPRAVVHPRAQCNPHLNEENVIVGSAKRAMIIEPRRATTIEHIPHSNMNIEMKIEGNQFYQSKSTQKTRKIIEPQTIKPPIRPAKPIPPPNHNLHIYNKNFLQSRNQTKEDMGNNEYVVVEALRNTCNISKCIAPGASYITPDVFDLRESSLKRSTSGLDVVNLLPDFYYKQGETITLARLPEIIKELDLNIDTFKPPNIKSPVVEPASSELQAPRKRANSSSTAHEKRRKRSKSLYSHRILS